MIDPALQFFGDALHLRGVRRGVIAANIANSDTPHYQARDFDFAGVLKNAMDGRAAPSEAPRVTLVTTNTAHLTANGQAEANDPFADVDLKWRNPVQPSLDGNTVSMDGERVRFIDNTLHYRFDLQMLTDQMSNLKLVMEPAS